MKKVFLESCSLEEALKRMFGRFESIGVFRLEGEMVDTRRAIGRVTATPVFAKYSSPAYHSAAMDGFAVHFIDTLEADENRPVLLSLGEKALSVDTGDPLPAGFDSVIMIEDVNAAGDSIEIYASSAPYQNVRITGEDIVATELILPENHVIRPVDAGAMLASGHPEIEVVRQPIVAIISTGTELVEPEAVRDRPPSPPEIINYNSAMLAALAEECGAVAAVYPIVRDDLKKIKEALLDAAGKCDMVIINAGSGRGTEDFTSSAISDIGELLFNGVSIRPGKPVMAGTIGNRPVLGIPGYPVSAFLTFRLFAAPLIRRFLGTSGGRGETVRAVISRQLASPLGIDEFVRVNVGLVDNKFIAAPAGRGAGLLMSVVRADGVIKIPSDSDGIAFGAEVDVEIFREKDELKNTVVCIGSHDNALDVLSNAVRKRRTDFYLSSSHVGSMGGIMALDRGEAHMAGVHLLDSETGEYNVSFIKRHLGGRRIVLINFVYRIQGFIVKKGNPKSITGFEDLAREDVVFINRQAGSGTRLLFDKCLADHGIGLSSIKGYDRDEYTHMAVASAVLTGLADTGLAVYSAAKALGLDFIPVAEERYDLAVPCEYMDMDKIAVIIDTIRHDMEFREFVKALGGYDMRHAGNIMFESKAGGG
jgi:putative molybdopterin biosynthesis protein